MTSDHDSSNSRYSLNTRLAFGTVLAGGHRSTAETITAHLGLLPPVVPSEWSKDMTRLNNVTETYATESIIWGMGILNPIRMFVTLSHMGQMSVLPSLNV